MRFYSLDVLRGLAALGVVLYHWGAFFVVPEGAPYLPRDFDASRLPLFDALFLFYRHDYGVDFFFCLSGFVLFWLYRDAIANGQIRGRDFAVLRFARLYPLHLATLLYVAAGQALHAAVTGHSFVYVENDPGNFMRHLVVFFSAGFGRTASFNGPVWSLCIEALLYLIFFLLCRIERPRAHVLLLLIVVSYAAVQRHFPDLARGLSAFFAGGLVYLAYEFVTASRLASKAETALKLLLTAVWLFTLFCIFDHRSLVYGSPLLWLKPYLPLLLLSSTLLYVALAERRRPWIWKKFSWLGDISYSSYLLHFPLMLTVATITDFLHINRAVYQSPAVLLAFFAALIGVSLVSFHRFERPMQEYLRRRAMPAYSQSFLRYVNHPPPEVNVTVIDHAADFRPQ